MYKLYLDDEREAPKDWIRCYWPNQVIDLMKLLTHRVSEISLDHDLGNDGKGTGYDVLTWIEEQVHTQSNFHVPMIHIHTANPSARQRMLAAYKAILKHRNF